MHTLISFRSLIYSPIFPQITQIHDMITIKTKILMYFLLKYEFMLCSEYVNHKYIYFQFDISCIHIEKKIFEMKNESAINGTKQYIYTFVCFSY